MNKEVEPIVGNWYRREDNGQTFTIVAVDEDEGIIEIQQLDGEIEEIDGAAWEVMELELVDEPVEWRGKLDELEDENDEDEYDDDEDEEDEEDDKDDDWRGSRTDKNEWDDDKFDDED